VRSVTQCEIARKINLDVSTVSKILNGLKGPVFRKETIRLVHETAREMGYRFRRPTKRALIDMILKLVFDHPDRETSPLCREALSLVTLAEPPKVSLK